MAEGGRKLGCGAYSSGAGFMRLLLTHAQAKQKIIVS